MTTNPLPPVSSVPYVATVFEELEQIPWSELVAKPRRPSRWALVAGALLIALGVFVVRSREPSIELPEAVGHETSEAAPAQPPAVSAEPTVMVSEADLQASDGSAELLALGAAVIEVRMTSTPNHYVEWAVAEGLTPLGSGRWSVQVAYQVLVAGPDGPIRTSIRRLSVPIEVSQGRAGRAGPLHLAAYDPAPSVDVWAMEATPVTPAMAEAVHALFAEWGDVTVVSAGTHAGLVRVLVDTGGMEVSVWFDGETRLPSVPVPGTVP